MFFFFKQKTAYDVRISDWSSDVCSSDLARACYEFSAARAAAGAPLSRGSDSSPLPKVKTSTAPSTKPPKKLRKRSDLNIAAMTAPFGILFSEGLCGPHMGRSERSEEHTSELQSLMRISYAVFCLKKKKTKSRTLHKH